MKTILTLSLVLVAAVAGANPQLLAYVAIEPCRLVDTRDQPGDVLVPGVIRNWTPTGSCGIPSDAVAIDANVTVTQAAGDGHLSILLPVTPVPTSPAAPTSLLNYRAGQTVSNSARIRLVGESFWTLASVSGTHMIVDVSGYYLPIN